MATRNLPVKVNVFGYIYDGECNPVENAALTFRSSKNFFRDGNHYNIDEDLVTDVNGRFSIPLYATKEGDQALATVRVTIEYTNVEGNDVFDSFDIIVDPELADETNNVNIQCLLVEAGSTTIFSGPRGPRGESGPRGLIGREIYNIARRDGAMANGAVISGRELFDVTTRWQEVASASSIRTDETTDDVELFIGVPSGSGILEFFELRLLYSELQLMVGVPDSPATGVQRLSLEVNAGNEVYLAMDADGNILIASRSNASGCSVTLRGFIYGRGIQGPPGERGEPGPPGMGEDGDSSRLVVNPAILTIGLDGATRGFDRRSPTSIGSIVPDITTVKSLLVTDAGTGLVGFELVTERGANKDWLDDQAHIWINDIRYTLGPVLDPTTNPHRQALGPGGNSLAISDSEFSEGDTVRLAIEDEDGRLSPVTARFSSITDYVDNELEPLDDRLDAVEEKNREQDERLDDIDDNTETYLKARDDAGSFNELDKLVSLVPVEQARPAHSNLQNFSRITQEGVTIDQSGRSPDFVAITYDDRSGSASPNSTVYMLATENVINAYTPQMQMEEEDAGPDLSDTPRKTLVLTDQNGEEIDGALFIDPRNGKLGLLLPMGELDLTFHFGRSGRVEASYRAIPAPAPGRIAGGFLKKRGDSGYTEVGIYIFDVLSENRLTAFPGNTTVHGMMLRITGLQSLVGGEYTGHLNLFLADLAFENVVVGEEVKLLPYEQIGEKIDQKIESQVGAVENRLQGEIDNLPTGGSSTYTPPFKIEILNADLSFPDGVVPARAVGQAFTVDIYVEGATNQGTDSVSITIGGETLRPVSVSGRGTVLNLLDGNQTLSFEIRDTQILTGLGREVVANGYASLQVNKRDSGGVTVRSGELYLPILSAPAALTGLPARVAALEGGQGQFSMVVEGWSLGVITEDQLLAILNRFTVYMHATNADQASAGGTFTMTIDGTVVNVTQPSPAVNFTTPIKQNVTFTAQVTGGMSGVTYQNILRNVQRDGKLSIQVAYTVNSDISYSEVINIPVLSAARTETLYQRKVGHTATVNINSDGRYTNSGRGSSPTNDQIQAVLNSVNFNNLEVSKRYKLSVRIVLVDGTSSTLGSRLEIGILNGRTAIGAVMTGNDGSNDRPNTDFFETIITPTAGNTTIRYTRSSVANTYGFAIEALLEELPTHVPTTRWN